MVNGTSSVRVSSLTKHRLGRQKHAGLEGVAIAQPFFFYSISCFLVADKLMFGLPEKVHILVGLHQVGMEERTTFGQTFSTLLCQGNIPKASLLVASALAYQQACPDIQGLEIFAKQRSSE